MSVIVRIVVAVAVLVGAGLFINWWGFSDAPSLHNQDGSVREFGKD